MMENQLKNDLLNAVFRNIAFTSPAAVYLAAFVTNPSGGGGTEPSGGYARQAVVFDPPAAGVVKNSASVTFGPATVDWGQVRWVGVYDAATGGNLLSWGGLGTSKDVLNGQSLVIAAGALEISLE